MLIRVVSVVRIIRVITGSRVSECCVVRTFVFVEFVKRVEGVELVH